MGFLVKSEKLKQSNGGSTKYVATSPSTKKMSTGITSKSSSRDNPISHQNSLRSTRSTKSFDRPKSSRSHILTSSSYAEKHGTTSLKSRIRAARKKGLKGDVYDLQYLVEEGPLSFRSFGFVGGFFMILASILDFMETEEDSLARLITYNLWLIGFITIQIEGRPFHMQVPLFYDIICLFFSFLQYVWGRGFLYFVAGCFQFFLFTKYNMVSGVYFMLLGTFSIVFGYKASVRLAGLRNSLHTRDEIKFMFHSFDKDRDGFLNADEFREMLRAMDQNLEHNDFVAAMSAVDKENKQMISYQDLETWWEGYNEDLPPGSGCLSSRQRRSHNPNAHLMT